MKAPLQPWAPLHTGPAPSTSCSSREWGAEFLLLSPHPDKHHIWSIHSPTTDTVLPPAELVQTTTPRQGVQVILFPAHPIQFPHSSQSDPSKTRTMRLPCSRLFNGFLLPSAARIGPFVWLSRAPQTLALQAPASSHMTPPDQTLPGSLGWAVSSLHGIAGRPPSAAFYPSTSNYSILTIISVKTFLSSPQQS